MTVSAFKITRSGLITVPVTEIIPDFSCVASEQPVGNQTLPYPLNGVAAAVGDGAVIMHCLTSSGKSVPVISQRFTV